MPVVEVDVQLLWNEFTGSRDSFQMYLQNVSTCSVDITWCNDCNSICEVDDTTWIEDQERSVCSDCYNNNGYHYCEECDQYVSEVHTHVCNCCSPQMQFTLRNDGQEPLTQDTPVQVTLGGGVISEEGLDAIFRYLCNPDALSRDLAYDVTDGKLGQDWQTKEGNFPKRLSRHAYKKYGIKLSPETMSQVGCIASEHSQPVDFTVEITRDLNLPAEDFCHEGSCWWSSYSESRCALKSNGGFGLRSFDGSMVTGRAWVLPLKFGPPGVPSAWRNPRPTFDTMNADAFVTFNGYGDLSQYKAARILAHMVGMTYRKIGFVANPMYVNSGGYLVAPEEIAAHYTDGRIELELSQHAGLYGYEQRTEDAKLIGHYQRMREDEIAHA